MSYFTLDEAVEGVRSAKSGPDLFDHMHKIFLLRAGTVDAYDSLEERASNVVSAAASPLDMYELKVAYARAPDSVRDAFMSVPEHEKLLAEARAVSEKAVKGHLEELGESVSAKHENFIRNIPKLRAQAEKASAEAVQVEKNRNDWIYQTKQQRFLEDTQRQKVMSAIQELRNEEKELLKERLSPEIREKLNGIYRQIDEIFNERMALEEAIEKDVAAESEILFPQRKQLWEQSRQAQDSKVEHENTFFQAVTEDLAAASGISEEQASAWANSNILIAENARTKLRRIGYSPEQLKKDIAELYRYVGGKLGPIEFVLEGHSSRAFARGKTLIAVQGSFNRETLFHECGHLAEAWDMSSQAACLQFVRDRAKGDLVSLKKLTGGSYRSNERAYPDDFYHPYVGKYYSHGASEVFSMGMQCFANPQCLAMLAEKDPEHFNLTIGICRRANPSLAKQLGEATAQVTARSKEMDRNKVWKKALDKVSGPEFGKLLADEEGYKNYRVHFWGRGGTLYRIQDNGDWGFMTSGKSVVLRGMAYLMIAHDEGLLPVRYDDPRTAYRQMEKTASGVAPDWFDPATPLSRV